MDTEITIRVVWITQLNNLEKNPFFFTWIGLLLHLSRRFLVIFLCTDFISSQIVRLCLFKVPSLFVSITKPSIRYSLFFIKFNCLFKTLNGLLVLLHSEKCCAFVMIIYRMFWFNIDSFIMRLYSFLVLFEFIVGRS